MAHLLSDPEALRRPGEKQFELSGWIDTAPFEDLVGLAIQTAADGRAVLSMPFTVKLAQGGGVVHGGALTTLADTAVAIAIKTLLPPGTIFATIELSIRFLAPAREGQLTATAQVNGPQGRTFHGEAVVVDDEGREVALFTSVFRVARGQGFGE
ncbi:MAG: PaaI family thioesterase [Desulfuromonadales bacterium]|nr:PaaI family thioesterase [Desulfuromonadales bacterium]